ncbi:MAG: transporter substrate-binding domain-containing protein [Caldilineaceae bacterium]|nr:transporter substrate-binding domain-containing protein [Caldilineaceae bacterium]
MKRPLQRPIWGLVMLIPALAATIVAACQPVSPAMRNENAPSVVAEQRPGAVWQRIKTKGELVVGTSADYPPFEYYNESYQLDGFDLALMRAIGEKLGLKIVVRDMAFDGLSSALELDQIDMAIAAITRTPERSQLVDFSDTYFVSVEGYLAAAGSPLSVTTLADLQGSRVGVQRGSIYEAWLRKNLVDAGIIPRENLILYNAVDGAVADLGAARIDVVVLDLLAAEAFAEDDAVQLAGQGIYPQSYAIAVRKGSGELVAQLNETLAELRADGTLTSLATSFLGLDSVAAEVPASQAPELASSLAAAHVGCSDGMAWESDLSLDDQNMAAPPVMFPGQPFAKSWRIRNSGTCTWDSTYSLAFARGNAPGASMSGAAVPIDDTVAPGESYDVTASLVAPLLPGTYQGFWYLSNADGAPFGETLRVGIQVAAVPTPTPAPTQTPVPGMVFYADSTAVQKGQPVTFYWRVDSSDARFFYEDGQEWQSNPVSADGSRTVYPDHSTVYHLRVSHGDGTTSTRSITVNVEQAAGAPQIDHFAVVPSGQIPAGTCVDLSWQVHGDLTAITVSRNDTVLWDGSAVEGTFQECPEEQGEYTYTIVATGPGGQDTNAAHVSVAGAIQQKAAAGPKLIDAFAVTPAEIAVNGCVTIAWNVGGAAEHIRLLRNDLTVLDGAPKTGTGSNCLTEAGTFTYRLEVTGGAGDQDAAEVAVTVALPTPTPLPAGGLAIDAALAAKSWLLTSYYDGAGNLISPVAGSQITASFGGDGSLTGVAGCNNYRSPYHAAGGTITIGTAATTRKFCATPAGIMDQEAAYLLLLITATNYTVSDNELTLSDGGGQTIAVYVAGE